MKYLFVLRGAPGCGKSTFIKRHKLEPYTISPDTLRKQMGSAWWTLDGIGINQSMNKKLFKDYFFPMLEERMRKGELIFIDATTSTAKELSAYRVLCRKYGYYIRIIDFTMIDENICYDNNDTREEYKRVPRSVIHKMYQNFRTEKIPKSIITIPFNEFHRDMLKLDPIDFSSYDHVFFIGDIHGCFDTLKNEVLPLIKENSAVVFVGDYFDRGSQQKEMYDWIVEHMDNPNYYFLIGNHEARIRQWLRTGKMQTNAFKDTLEKIGATKKDWKHFYKRLWSILNINYNGQRFVVTHGGLSDVYQVSKKTASYQFVHGIGGYDDVDTVRSKWTQGNDSYIQVFGHRYDKTIYKDMSFDLCGNPEQNGTIRFLDISLRDNHVVFSYNEVKTNFFSQESFVKEFLKGTEPVNDEVKNKIRNENYIDMYRSNPFVKERQMVNNHISSFNFTKEAFWRKNWNGITTRARGLFVNTNTKKIVARSYNKFFLFNEMPESSEEYIRENYNFPVYAFQKYDGYLCIVGYDEEFDELVYTSKSVMSDQGINISEYADYFKAYLHEYTGFNEEIAKHYLKTNNVSLVFEMVSSPFDPHLIKYSCKRIYLLDIIKNDFEFHTLFENYDNVYDYLNGLDNVIAYITKNNQGIMDSKRLRYIFKDSDSLFSTINSMKTEDGEGFVLCDFKNHRMFKLKTYRYEVLKAMRNVFYIYVKNHDISKINSLEHFEKAYPSFLYRQITCVLEYCRKLSSVNENNEEADFYKNPNGYELACSIMSHYIFN